MKLTPNELWAAREWLYEVFVDAYGNEGDEDAINEASDARIERAISKHYSGGIEAFKRDNQEAA